MKYEMYMMRKFDRLVDKMNQNENLKWYPKFILDDNKKDERIIKLEDEKHNLWDRVFRLEDTIDRLLEDNSDLEETIDELKRLVETKGSD